MTDYEDYFDDDQPSKTQRKKDAHAQQKLGKRLTELPDHSLDELPLTDPLRAAIAEFKRIPHKRGAVKRQLQYIGRLIRDCDTDAIDAALDENQLATADPAVSNAQPDAASAEFWCDIIVTQGDDGIQQTVDAITAINRQELRQLYRNYSGATDSKKAAARQRILNYLHPFLDAG